MRRITILLAAMAALMLVPAAQAFANHTLTVNVEGTGAGEVSSVGGWEENGGVFEGTTPIECSYEFPFTPEGNCEEEMEELEPGFEGIYLHPIPAEGSEFAGWTVEAGSPTYGEVFGLCEYGEGNNGCLVTSEKHGGGYEDGVVTAVFNEEVPTTEFPLTLKINEGQGTVVSNPAGIECTETGGANCTSEFEEGSEVVLTASPAAGYRFNYWGSCPSPNGRQCTVTMSEAKEVKAFFVKVWKLTVSKTAGSLPGLVAMNPPGDACLYNCQSVSYSYKTGAEVVLTGNDFGNKHLVEFTGGTGSAAACDGETECTVTIGEEDSSIEALFGLNAKAKLSVEKAGGGTASIRAVGGFKCRSTCGSASAEYFENLSEEITIYWELEPGTSSIDWGSGGGTCSGVKTTNGNCKVTMNEDHELVATLE